ncbi:hypothetical protein RRG08_036771, partial [Elysia crispata]
MAAAVEIAQPPKIILDDPSEFRPEDRLRYWMKLDHGEMTVMEILEKLNSLKTNLTRITDLPNAMHAFRQPGYQETPPLISRGSGNMT